MAEGVGHIGGAPGTLGCTSVQKQGNARFWFAGTRPACSRRQTEPRLSGHDPGSGHRGASLRAVLAAASGLWHSPKVLKQGNACFDGKEIAPLQAAFRPFARTRHKQQSTTWPYARGTVTRSLSCIAHCAWSIRRTLSINAGTATSSALSAYRHIRIAVVAMPPRSARHAASRARMCCSCAAANRDETCPRSLRRQSTGRA